MQTVVSAEEMQWCDRTAIRTYRIPGLVLMENAGRGSTDCLEKRFGPLVGKSVLILCGKGNNGGDGFVVARHLLAKGATVIVLLLASPRDLKGDAKINFRILQSLQSSHLKQLRIRPFSPATLRRLPAIDCTVDAIFGTGFSGKVSGAPAKAIAWLNEQEVPVVSLDIPSGVHGTTGIVESHAVSATLTTTYGLVKTGLLCNQGQDHAGHVEVVDIGLPPVITHSPDLRTKLVTAESVKRVLPQRKSAAHKYEVGKVFLLAGSRGYTGAAALAASGALRSGAGAVLLGTPESVYPILARKLTGEIVMPLPATDEGSLSQSGLESILKKVDWADVVAVGPGLSLHPETQALILDIIKYTPGKLLLDADALACLTAPGLKSMRGLKSQITITPHVGEASRILNIQSKQIERDRIAIARNTAGEGGCVVVLKGGPTATGNVDGTVYLNSSGNPGMATVGSGDVLTGLLAGMWAQGMGQVTAAFSSVFLHGLAGDCAARKVGMRSLVAQDLLDFLPDAFRLCEQGAGS